MACAVETNRVSLEDCTCPICMCILIEPVTMPCHHELCRPCFKQNVEEASLLCPMCRTRIGTWARHATKTKTLVNEVRWEQIQKLFPKRVRLRLEGKDEEDDSMDVSFHPQVHLAAPGEIRKEYEEELKKLRQQMLQERRNEELESEALIRRLQDEEAKERAKRDAQHDQVNQEDEILARELDKVINEAGTDDPINLLLEESKSRLTRSNSVTSSKSTHSNSGPLDSFLNKYKAQAAESHQTEARQISPYPYPCISPSDKAKPKEDSPSTLSLGKCSNSSAKTDIYPFSFGDHTYCPNPNASKSSTVARPPSEEIVTISETSSEASKDRSESRTKRSESGKDRSESTNDRSESVVSTDSITNELSHFKPILSVPRTPPRKMTDGKLVDPPVVRTTPRNLSRNGFASPVDCGSPLEPASPIMQRRLSELALERKMQVQERSKSTSTGPSTSDATITVDKKVTSKLTRLPLRSVGEDQPESLGSSSGLLIPLESRIEDNDFDDITPVFLNSRGHNSNTVQKAGTSSHEHKPMSASSFSPVQSKSPAVERSKRSRHTSNNQKTQSTNQRSIRDWFKQNDDKARTGSADLFDDVRDTNSDSDVVCNEPDICGDRVVGKDTKVSQNNKNKSSPGKSTAGKVRKKNTVKSEHGVVDAETIVKKRVRRKKNQVVDSDYEVTLNEESDSEFDKLSAAGSPKGSRVRKERSKTEKDSEISTKVVSKNVRKVKGYIDESDFEMSVSESEMSSPTRKSNRRRRKMGEYSEDFELDLDTLGISDTDQSEVAHPTNRTKPVKKYRKPAKTKSIKNTKSALSDDEFTEKGNRGNRVRIRGGRKKKSGIDDSSSDSDDDEHVKERKVRTRKSKQGKGDNLGETGSKHSQGMDNESDPCPETAKQTVVKHKKSKVVKVNETKSVNTNSNCSGSKEGGLRSRTRHKINNSEDSSSSDDESKSIKSKAVTHPRRRGRRRNKDDDFHPMEIDMDSDASTVSNCSTVGKLKRRGTKDVIEEVIVSDSDQKKRLTRHKGKGERNIEESKTRRKGKSRTDYDDEENATSDIDGVRQVSSRKNKCRKLKGDDDIVLDLEIVEKVKKKSSPRKTKASPKKSSPKKNSLQKSPKKEESSEVESSPCKRQKTRHKQELLETDQVVGKRSRLKKCATEELLEENVDPNAERTCSDSSPRKRVRKNKSDDIHNITPSKKSRKEITDTDDDAFASPSKHSLMTQISKKRSESVSLKSMNPKTPTQKKGRRHTAGDQQSIVRYLSGASDVDVRQDIDVDFESDATEGFSQEEEDRKLALKLQRQFDLQEKWRMSAERFKGGTEQYQFRRKPKYLD